jgi:hypothetical protein
LLIVYLVFIAHNVKCLKAAGFSACEFERSENEQVEKPADFQAYVKGMIIIK